MPNVTWTKTTAGPVIDTLGNSVGSGDGAGTITITAALVQVSDGATHRIEEGVTIKMANASGQFLVTRNATGSGILRIVGTEAEPVIMTSDEVTPAAGDYGVCVEMSNATAASNPTLEADWCIFEYATTGIFGSGSQPKTVTLRNCTFRRIQHSYIQSSAGQIVGANGLWRAESCVFDKCTADEVLDPGSANNLIICSGTAPSGSGVAFRMEIDHCSILEIIDNSTQDREIFQAGPRGDLDVRNTIAVGTNNHIVRELFTAIVLAPSGVFTHDWNWTLTDDPGGWVNNTNDDNIDPNYFDDDCSGGNSDLRPDDATGVSTADEFGALLGALEPYNVPPIEPPVEPPVEAEDCEGEYVDYTDPQCIPVACDYDFFTGEYPEDWRVELYDKKNTSAHQLVVCITLPNKGIDADFVFAPGVPIELISISDETVIVNLGKWVQAMRPVKAERDVTFKEYQGSDIDLVFLDWFGRLDPKIQGSLFHNLRWPGLRVDIGSWICGTEQVLKLGRFFIDDAPRGITRRGESTVIRLKDWFLALLSEPLRANHAGFLTARVKGTGSLVAELINIDSDIAIVEKVKLVFVDLGREDSDVFEYIGSVTGFQGQGTVGSNFTTDDGAVTIPFTAWLLSQVGGGFFTPGDELNFILSNGIEADPVRMIYLYLTEYGDLIEGEDIIEAEFLEALELLPTLATVLIRHTSPVTLLEACRIAARHGFLSLATNAEGRVVLGGFKPRLALDLAAIQEVCIASSNDLKELETENLDIYNLIRASYNPTLPDGITHSGIVGGAPGRWLNYPTDDLGPNFNRSAIFYGEPGAPQYYPFDVDLPGFRAGQEAAVFAILQNYWIFFEGTPTAREKLKLTTKLHNLNRDLEDIVYVSSLRPARSVWGQVVGFSKDPLSHEIELTVVDISDIVQPDFACGYAFCDSEHYTDDCWVCW